MYRAYILDDERKAVETLEFLIGHAIPEFSEIRKHTDPDEAIIEINDDPPDILFLDIQMPGKSGFEVIRAIKNLNFEVVFTTAHDQFAIDAIKVSALDYLLKPVDVESLRKTFERFKTRYRKFDYKKEYEFLKRNISKKGKNKLTIYDLNGMRIVELNDITRLQADGNYTKIFLQDGQSIMNSKTLKEFEDTLSGTEFIRVHKSHLVNFDKITSFIKNEYLILTDGSEIPVARRKRKEVKDLLV